MEDLPSSEEVLDEDCTHKQRALANIPPDRIVYGAFHMRCVMSFLMQKLNYRVVKAEWVKVFDL